MYGQRLMMMIRGFKVAGHLRHKGATPRPLAKNVCEADQRSIEGYSLIYKQLDLVKAKVYMVV